ncbi:MAG: EAL domain-containing protein [Betaproteobacteria bacterium]|nr:EAL domain-containing protein [Betaproteobacteria bacterium]
MAEINPQLDRQRVLIVEDEAVIAMELAELLRECGLEVVGSAASGELAIAEALDKRPDLVMMDIMIKGPMDGIEAATRIRAKLDVPVVFLTAYGDPATLERAKRVAPYGYLLKPYRPDALRATVGVALYKHQLERRLHESEARFHGAFDHAAIGMALVARSGRFLQVNRAMSKLFGWSAEELLASNLAALARAEDRELDQSLFAKLDAGDRPSAQLERVFMHRNGDAVWMQMSASVVRDHEHRPAYYVVQLQDIHARKIAEERLHYLAHFDPLTGLENRASLHSRLEQAMSLAQRNRRHLAVVFADLDGFKLINDSYGHRTGDALLRQVGERLKRTLRAEDLIARIGGDEFVVVISDAASDEVIGVVARKIIDALSRPYLVEGREVVVTASLGIGIYPSDGENCAQLLRNADSAMYHSKELGKNRFCFYNENLTRRAVERVTLETALRQALPRGEFRLVYQPIIENGQPLSAEALLRWDHPERGAIAPDVFIPIAEETHLLPAIGDWVLRSACAQLRRWRDEGMYLQRVAVNVSFQHLVGPGFSGVVEAALDESGLDGASLEIEITESSAMQDPERTIRVLQALRARGVLVSIDDFGTGYSSLSHLARLPLNRVKIDRSFVRDLPSGAAAAAVVGAIAALGRTLALNVVAEGVENAEQAAFLDGEKINEMQGFHFSKPLSPQALSAFVRGAASRRPGAARAA